MIMDNILDINSDAFYNISPEDLAGEIAHKARKRRLSLNLTQMALAKKSGVSLGSLKRFENTGEISLKNLLLLAICLDATQEFVELFKTPSYNSVDEVIKAKKTEGRKRGRKHD